MPIQQDNKIDNQIKYILAIDPSLTQTGIAVVRKDQNTQHIYYIESDVIKTKASDKIEYRLMLIGTKVNQLINKYNIKEVAMETTFVNINAASSLKLAYVRGAIMSEIGKNNCSLFEYSPNKVKKTISITGHASKEQVAHMVSLLVKNISTEKIQKLYSDETDAIAIAYTHIIHSYNS